MNETFVPNYDEAFEVSDDRELDRRLRLAERAESVLPEGYSELPLGDLEDDFREKVDAQVGRLWRADEEGGRRDLEVIRSIARELAIPEMMLIVTFQNFRFDPSRLRASKEYREILQNNDHIRAIEAIMKLVKQEMITQLKVFTAGLTGEEVHPAFSEENIDKILEEGPFRHVGGTHSPAYSVWHEVYNQAAEVRDGLIGEYVELADTPDLRPAIAVELQNMAPVRDAVSKFFIAWNDNQNRLMSSDDRKKLGYTDQMATIERRPDGSLVEVKWNIAFQTEIESIVESYEGLANSLELRMIELEEDGTLSTEDRDLFNAKIRYYHAVATAYRVCAFKDFVKADAEYVKQVGGVPDASVYVHTIEYNYWDDKVQRIPGSSLRLRDQEKGAEVMRHADQTQARMIRHLPALFDMAEVGDGVRGTLSYVEGSFMQVNIFIDGGYEFAFPASGQMLPNEPEARVLGGGVGVTTNYESHRGRFPSREKAFRAVFGDELTKEHSTVAILEARQNRGMGTYLASHEFGHAIGLYPGIFDDMDKNDNNSFAEEWKATNLGMILSEYMPYLDPEEDREEILSMMRDNMIDHLGNLGRYASQRKSSEAAAYLRKTFVLMNAAEEAGIVYEKEDGTWGIDLAEEKMIRVYEIILPQCCELLQAYDQGTNEALHEWIDKYVKAGKFVRYGVERVDKAFPNMEDAPTIEDLCAH